MGQYQDDSSIVAAARPLDVFATLEEDRTPENALHLAAVVVTFNRLSHVRKTVARLLEEPCDSIFIIDNGSTDGTREWMDTLDDRRIRTIKAPGNLGGAGGFELGLRKAMELDDPDWIVIMDDDARPYSGCLSSFREQDLSEWDAVATAVYMNDGRICEMNRPTINPFWHLPTFLRTIAGTMIGRSRGGFHIPDEAYEDNPIEIDATSFVGLFLSRKAIEQAGYPDGSLFIYGDDVLYTLGLRKEGMKIGFLPELRFEHDFNIAGNAKQGLYTPVWKAYYNARNGLLVYRFAAGILFWPAFMFALVKWLLAGRHYGDGKRAYYRMVWHGVRDGLLGRRSRPHAEVTSLATVDI